MIFVLDFTTVQMVWIFSHRFINTRRNPRISWV